MVVNAWKMAGSGPIGIGLFALMDMGLRFGFRFFYDLVHGD